MNYRFEFVEDYRDNTLVADELKEYLIRLPETQRESEIALNGETIAVVLPIKEYNRLLNWIGDLEQEVDYLQEAYG